MEHGISDILGYEICFRVRDKCCMDQSIVQSAASSFFGVKNHFFHAIRPTSNAIIT